MTLKMKMFLEKKQMKNDKSDHLEAEWEHEYDKSSSEDIILEAKL